MSMHPEFPVSPYDPLVPAHRWFPAAEALRDSSYEKLLPPLVATIRDEVHDWRSGGYRGASPTTKALTVQDTGSSRIEDRISLRQTRPFRTEARDFVTAKKSVFNRIVGEVHGGGLELAFARFLEAAQDVQAFAKNYLAVGFRLDYVKTDGDLSTYTPDFIVRDTGGTVWIIETKGREELDIPQKMARLEQWCADATAAEAEEGGNGTRYGFIYVDQDGFEKHSPQTLSDLVTSFTEFKSN